MRRFLIPVSLLVAARLLSACGDSSVSQCFETGAAAYPVRSPFDTTVTFAWPTSFMPVRVYAEPVDSTPQNVLRGMQLWVSAFRCSELSLQVWPDSVTADIVVRNPPSLPPSPPAGVAFMAGDSVNACLGKTVFALDSAGFVVRPIRTFVSPNSIDTAAVEACYHFVTAHELGHAFGLLSHSPNPNDLMNAIPRHTALSPSDKYTIQLLYHLTPTVAPEHR